MPPCSSMAMACDAARRSCCIGWAPSPSGSTEAATSRHRWPGRTGANIAGVALADVAVAGSGCVSAGGHWGEEAAAQMGDR